jgi:hypothetical protein
MRSLLLIGFALGSIGCNQIPSRTVAHSVFVISDGHGKALGNVFEGIATNKWVSAHAEILNVSRSTSCGKQSIVVGILERLFSLPIVEAHHCPNCLDPYACSGVSMKDIPAACGTECGGGSRPSFFSLPLLADPWNGWCYTGAHTCGQCANCLERSCYAI